MEKKGFTLLELLIVIAILAVLAATVVFALNPAEMLKKARDAQRMTDLSSLKSATVLLLSEVSGACIGKTDAPKCPTGATACIDPTYNGICKSISGKTAKNDGTGWMGIDFTDMSPAPLGNLPMDPTNNTTYYYSYRTDGTDFEINALLESTYYRTTVDADGKDGGDDQGRPDTDHVYEVGTKLNMVSPIT